MPACAITAGGLFLAMTNNHPIFSLHLRHLFCTLSAGL